jgi:hypothetical protein
MRWPAGILYSMTALLTGYAAFYMMMQTVNAGPWSQWGPVMLGAAILLMVVGVRAFVARLAAGWLAVIAAAIPLAICSAFGTWPLRCWVFAFALGLSALAIFKVDAAVQHGDVAAFIVSLLLAVSWISTSIDTVNVYLSPNVMHTNPATLGVLCFFWALIIPTLSNSGSTIFRRPSVR